MVLFMRCITAWEYCLRYHQDRETVWSSSLEMGSNIRPTLLSPLLFLRGLHSLQPAPSNNFHFRSNKLINFLRILSSQFLLLCLLLLLLLLLLNIIPPRPVCRTSVSQNKSLKRRFGPKKMEMKRGSNATWLEACTPRDELVPHVMRSLYPTWWACTVLFRQYRQGD
jgi:hypothetical protein